MRRVASIKQGHIFVASALLLSVIAFAVNSSSSNAAALTQTLVRFDRMKTSTATTGTVCAKPTTIATEADVQVTFPAGYTVSATAGNWTVNTTNLAWPAPSIVTANQLGENP